MGRAATGRMPYGFEVHGGPAFPIATELNVSGGGGDTGVSSWTTTTFEIDGCVVEYDDVVPFRPGDEVVVAGRRDGRGVLNAYAIRLPRQGVLLSVRVGMSRRTAHVLMAAGSVLFVWAIAALSSWGLAALGAALVLAGAGAIARAGVVVHARGLVTRPWVKRAPPGDNDPRWVASEEAVLKRALMVKP